MSAKTNEEKKIKKIDVLKIDVEGGEFDILKGSKKILNYVQILQIEVYQNKKNFNYIKEKIISFLNKYNFKVIKKKAIWSASVFSNLRGEDILLVKK